MQLRCLYGAGAIAEKKQQRSNPDGKGMFLAVYLLQKAGVRIWEKGGACYSKSFGVVCFFVFPPPAPPNDMF